jgi:hypothetical protein
MEEIDVAAGGFASTPPAKPAPIVMQPWSGASSYVQQRNII